MSKYYDLDKLKELIEAKAETLIGDGAIAFHAVGKWLDFLPAADVATVQPSIDDVRNLPTAAPVEDAVSRETLLDGLASIAKAKARSDAQKALMGRVMFFAEHLPPVTPKPRTGKWIHQGYKDEWWCDVGKCSACGLEYIFGLPYCPQCGTKMEGESK